MFRLFTWVAIFSVAGLVAAKAATIGPEKATELLARAHAINIKCNVLGGDDGQTLSNLLAQAEIALATKKSVKAARSALERGRVTGQAASCDGVSSKAVTDVLGAARSASTVNDIEVDVDVEVGPEKPLAKPAVEVKQTVAAAETKKVELEKVVAEEPAVIEQEPAIAEEEPAKPAVERAKPKVAAVRRVPSKVRVAQTAKVRLEKPRRSVARLTFKKPKPVVRVARASAAKPVVLTRRVQAVQKPKVIRSSGNGYGALAETYYKELRCRNLTRGSVNAMYARVLREHRAAVNSQGAGAVRSLLRNAQSRAASRAC